MNGVWHYETEKETLSDSTCVKFKQHIRVLVRLYYINLYNRYYTFIYNFFPNCKTIYKTIIINRYQNLPFTSIDAIIPVNQRLRLQVPSFYPSLDERDIEKFAAYSRIILTQGSHSLCDYLPTSFSRACDNNMTLLGERF